MISALFLYSAYKVAVLDLSINKLQSGQDTPQTRMLLNVMKNLQFPSFKVLQVQCILWMVKRLIKVVVNTECKMHEFSKNAFL